MCALGVLPCRTSGTTQSTREMLEKGKFFKHFTASKMCVVRHIDWNWDDRSSGFHQSEWNALKRFFVCNRVSALIARAFGFTCMSRPAKLVRAMIGESRLPQPKLAAADLSPGIRMTELNIND